MAQNDFTIANQGFPAFRADLNSALQALATNSSGATEPSTIFAYQPWYDSTTDTLKIRNADNDAWITLFTFNQTTDTVSVEGTDLVDDTTPQLGGTLDANGNDIDMGTNTITDTKVGQWDTAYGWGDHSTQNYAKTNTAQTFSASQRGQVDTQNTMPFDLNVANNFSCTPTAAIDLAFSNETAGQTGMIYLDNSAAVTVTADADVHISTTDLTAISAAGVYIVTYYCPDGTNVYLSASAALTEGS